jgi:WD40 repeat protein
VSALAWFPDGQRLAATTSGGVLLADGKTLVEAGVLLSGQAVANVDVARDGTLMALAVTDTAQLWSQAGTEWQSRRLEGGGGKVFGVALSPDNALLAAGEVSGTVRVWDVQQGTQVQVWQAHRGETFDVAFSPDGALLASAGRDGFVRLWRVGTWELAGSFQHADAVHGIAFSPDGRLLAAASYDSTVGVWDVASGQEVHALRGHIAQVNCVGFSPDGKLLASGGMDGTVRVWDVAVGKTVAWSEDTIDPVSAVAFSPDGQTMASAGWDRAVRLWDIGSLR